MKEKVKVPLNRKAKAQILPATEGTSESNQVVQRWLKATFQQRARFGMRLSERVIIIKEKEISQTCHIPHRAVKRKTFLKPSTTTLKSSLYA